MKSKEELKARLNKIVDELKRIQLETNQDLDSYMYIVDGLETAHKYKEGIKEAILEYKDRAFELGERAGILDDAIQILENIKEI